MNINLVLYLNPMSFSTINTIFSRVRMLVQSWSVQGKSRKKKIVKKDDRTNKYR